MTPWAVTMFCPLMQIGTVGWPAKLKALVLLVFILCLTLLASFSNLFQLFWIWSDCLRKDNFSTISSQGNRKEVTDNKKKQYQWLYGNSTLADSGFKITQRFYVGTWHSPVTCNSNNNYWFFRDTLTQPFSKSTKSRWNENSNELKCISDISNEKFRAENSLCGSTFRDIVWCLSD